MSRSVQLAVRLRGVAPSSSLASLGWAGHKGGCGTVRKGGGILPLRAGVQEPDWKLYERGDPELFDNWHGKTPNALPEDAEVNPNVEGNMFVDLVPDYGSTFGHTIRLCLALLPFVGLGVAAHYVSQYRQRNAIAHPPDYRTLPPETVTALVELFPNLPADWRDSAEKKGSTGV